MNLESTAEKPRKIILLCGLFETTFNLHSTPSCLITKKHFLSIHFLTQIFTKAKQPRWRRCRFKEKGSSTVWADSTRSQFLWASCYKCTFSRLSPTAFSPAQPSVVLRFLIIFSPSVSDATFDMMFFFNRWSSQKKICFSVFRSAA